MARMVNEMKKNFTVVHNQFLQDPELGIAERGLLMTMLSKPDSYDFSIKGLASLLPNGETAIRTALINLENSGILGEIVSRRRASLLTSFTEFPIVPYSVIPKRRIMKMRKKHVLKIDK